MRRGRVTRRGEIAWFARHEARIAFRDLGAMLRAGRKTRVFAAIALVVAASVLHLIAWSTVAGEAARAAAPDLRTLALVTTGLALTASLLLSQAIESITRVLYGRGDLDLILSSPLSPWLVLATRVTVVATTVSTMTLFLAGPFANVLAAAGGARWLCIYPVVFALGIAMTALGLLVTLALVRFVGIARTRLAAQIVAALIGAGFAIGLQMAAIAEYGQLSRFAVATSDTMLALAPSPESLFWWPARAATGDPVAALAFVLGCAVLFAGTLAACLRRLAGAAYATGGLAVAPVTTKPKAFATGSPGLALMRKEWRLLVRDPWLVSQTLMQMLYLLPPAFMLWRSYGDGGARLAILAPILVMTAGQLAGSLAWLAISGEDAPDLIASAPIDPAQAVRAKVASVLVIVGAAILPFAVALGLVELAVGIAVVAGAVASSVSAFMIQFWFRHQASRSQFRRRQTSSRLATFAEAFSSILWAGAAALASIGTWLAVPVGLLALVNLAGARALSPGRPARRARPIRDRSRASFPVGAV